MKIFIACSKHFYDKIPPIQEALHTAGHETMLPNSYDEPFKEMEMKERSPEEHRQWKAEIMRTGDERVLEADAILVLNFEKRGQANYIGGATFLEIFRSFDAGKKIFLYNPIPENIFEDELHGMGPVVIEGNLDLVR